eukprot:gene1447-2787_t
MEQKAYFKYHFINLYRTLNQKLKFQSNNFSRFNDNSSPSKPKVSFLPVENLQSFPQRVLQKLQLNSNQQFQLLKLVAFLRSNPAVNLTQDGHLVLL